LFSTFFVFSFLIRFLHYLFVFLLLFYSLLCRRKHRQRGGSGSEAEAEGGRERLDAEAIGLQEMKGDDVRVRVWNVNEKKRVRRGERSWASRDEIVKCRWVEERMGGC
jgi:hypothetical protein